MKKRDARKLNAGAQEALRMRIARYLRLGRGTQQQAADIFQLSLPAVKKIWKQYKPGGTKGLKAKKRGPHNSTSLLAPVQVKLLTHMIKQHTPEHYALPFTLWTAGAVRMLIKKTRVSYSERYVAKLLGKWNFTYQKPTVIAYERSPAEVQRWIKQRYPLIKQKAEKQRGVVFWVDEAGMRSQHQAGKSFAPRGKTPIVKKSEQRFYLNMISALSNKGQLVFMIAKQNFNYRVFISFLEKLLNGVAGRKVFLIADNHPAHKHNKVMQWIEEHKRKIELFFLPSYAPQLNPDEYFNQDIKTNAVGKQRPKSKEEMKKLVDPFARSKKKRPEKVKAYFHPSSVNYAQ